MKTFLAFAAAYAAAFTVGHYTGPETRAGFECSATPDGVTCDTQAACDCGVSMLDELSPIGNAYAGPVFVAQLNELDAGQSQTQQITPKRCYCIQSLQNRECMKLSDWDGGMQTVNCLTDFRLPVPLAPEETLERSYCFESGTKTAITVANIDAGVATANLFLLEMNPQSSNFVCAGAMSITP